jgi:hypothetical protein
MQRGRRSAHVLSFPRVDGTPEPLSPPKYLNTAERTAFQELIASVDTRSFVQSDIPLLVSYIQSTLMVRKTARDPKQIANWEKAVRAQAMLATRLRISPQSRYDARAAARQLEPKRRKPWL